MEAMERRREDRREDLNSDRREEFTYLNVPGLNYLSQGDRRRVRRRKNDQEPSLQSRHPLF
jgi:hypothetical protein